MKLTLLVWFIFILPLLYLFYKLGFSISYLEGYSKLIHETTNGTFGTFPNDPIKFISDITGITALHFLILTLSITPLSKILKLKIKKQRRRLGLMTFFYAFNHMFLYFLLDHELNLISLFHEAFDKWFIFFGMAALLILTFMAITSSKKLFARFFKWHQLIYLATIFIAIHYILSQKIVTLTPVAYVLVLSLLLLLRREKIINQLYTSSKK